MRLTGTRVALSFALLVGAQLLVASESASASQPGESGGSVQSLLPSPPPKIRPDPYARLFQVPDLKKKAEQALNDFAASRELSQPRVVCGLTVKPADPSLDAKMSSDPRRSDTQYSIRTLQPPNCQ